MSRPTPRARGSAAVLLALVVAATVPLPLASAAGVPWTVATGWRVTWHVASSDPFLNGTTYRVFITSASQGSTGTWQLAGSASVRGLLGDGWVTLHENAVLATLDPDAGTYTVSTMAVGEGFVFLPVGLGAIQALDAVNQGMSAHVQGADLTATLDPSTLTYSVLNTTSGKPVLHISFDASGVPVNYTRWNGDAVSHQLVIDEIYDPATDLLNYLNLFIVIVSGTVITVVVVALLRRNRISVDSIARRGGRPGPVREQDGGDIDSAEGDSA